MVIRCIIINRISRVGDVGEPGYSVYGEDVPACKKSGSHDHWHGATQDNLIHVMPTCYITRSVYNFLTDSERNEIRSKVRGVCEDDCIHRISNPYYGGGQCWALNESKIITDFPYPHVPSHPFCLDGTFHQVYRYPGADEYVVSGIVENYPYCDGDTLLPLCTEGVRSDCIPCPDGTEACRAVCEGRVWKNTGETCPPYVPPKPECTEGDKKPGHVCSGGKWVPVGTPPDVAPKYLTAAEAAERFRMGLPCYIKCVLPILDMLPGIPYTPGAWIPPFCAITTEP